jgi:hypothetical protein
MLYLAKVSLTRETGEASLQLLARQKSEHHWVISTNKPSIALPHEGCSYGDGVLVVARLNSDRQVESIEDATDWVLDVIEKYLLRGIAPDVLYKEAERAEEWRKDLTLKTQDLARRALELETRRDQIQELEKKLESERQQLEALRLKVEQTDDHATLIEKSMPEDTSDRFEVEETLASSQRPDSRQLDTNSPTKSGAETNSEDAEQYPSQGSIQETV